MKKTKIIPFILLLSILTTNINAKLVNKKTIEKIQTITSILAILDQVTQFIPLIENYRKKEGKDKPSDDFKFQLCPDLQIKIPKVDIIKAKNHNDTHFSIHPIGFLSEILASSTEKHEGLLSVLANAIIKIEKLKLKKDNNYDRKDLYLYEGLTILAEKVCGFLVNGTLNTAIHKHRIIKRLLKVILLTGISFGANYLRHEIVLPNRLKDSLPEYTTVFVDKFVTTLVIEIFGELLQRFIISDPREQKIKEEKEKFHQKLQNIIAGSPFPHFYKEYKNKKEEAEEDLFPCAVV